MNAMLRHTSDLIDTKAHRALVQLFFPAEVARQILALQNRFTFYRQQILFVAQTSLLVCQGASDKLTQDDFYDLGQLFLMASDLIPSDPPPPSSNQLEHFLRFVFHFVAIEESSPHHFEHKITRAYVMLSSTADKLKDTGGFIDVRREFETNTQITVD